MGPSYGEFLVLQLLLDTNEGMLKPPYRLKGTMDLTWDRSNRVREGIGETPFDCVEILDCVLRWAPAEGQGGRSSQGWIPLSSSCRQTLH